jgi:hypothetical protein
MAETSTTVRRVAESSESGNSFTSPLPTKVGSDNEAYRRPFNNPGQRNWLKGIRK